MIWQLMKTQVTCNWNLYSNYWEGKLMGKTNFEAIKKTVRLLPLRLISGILIIFFGITGCSDMPYTGSMLTPNDVDRYLITHSDGKFCLHNGTDSACLTLVPKRKIATHPSSISTQQVSRMFSIMRVRLS